MLVTILATAIPLSVQAEGMSKDLAARYILATAKAFRTTYVKQVISNAKKGGVKPSEDWKNSSHAIMLPAQLVKEAGARINDFELSLVGLDPIYKSNLPKTDKEKEQLKRLKNEPGLKVVTFKDGDNFVGLSADFAIVQGCASCHNKHPSSPKKDYKVGEFMGAIVVRFKN
jgi:hypothetical protein